MPSHLGVSGKDTPGALAMVAHSDDDDPSFLVEKLREDEANQPPSRLTPALQKVVFCQCRRCELHEVLAGALLHPLRIKLHFHFMVGIARDCGTENEDGHISFISVP